MGWIFSAAARQGSFEPPFSFRLGEKKMAVHGQKKSRLVQTCTKCLSIAVCTSVSLYPATDALTLHPRRALRAHAVLTVALSTSPGGVSKGEGRSAAVCASALYGCGVPLAGGPVYLRAKSRPFRAVALRNAPAGAVSTGRKRGAHSRTARRCKAPPESQAAEK